MSYGGHKGQIILVNSVPFFMSCYCYSCAMDLIWPFFDINYQIFIMGISKLDTVCAVALIQGSRSQRYVAQLCLKNMGPLFVNWLLQTTAQNRSSSD